MMIQQTIKQKCYATPPSPSSSRNEEGRLLHVIKCDQPASQSVRQSVERDEEEQQQVAWKKDAIITV